MTKHKHVATCHIDSRVQRSCRHTTCTPTAKATYAQLHWLSSGTTSAHITGLHEYQVTQIQTHKHQRSPV